MTEDVAGPESDHSHVALILLRGVEDLPDNISGWIAGSLDATPFNSDWKNPENFDQKLRRLNDLVDQEKVSGKEIIFIGVSAGGGLGMTYILAHPDIVRHLFSLNGLIDPNLPVNAGGGHMADLCRDNPSFKEMCDLLTGKLHLPDGEVNDAVIERFRLKEIVSTYSSGPGDEIVPWSVSEPSWVIKKHRVGPGKHAISIARMLVLDLREQLDQLKKARFD